MNIETVHYAKYGLNAYNHFALGGGTMLENRQYTGVILDATFILEDSRFALEEINDAYMHNKLDNYLEYDNF